VSIEVLGPGPDYVLDGKHHKRVYCQCLCGNHLLVRVEKVQRHSGRCKQCANNSLRRGHGGILGSRWCNTVTLAKRRKIELSITVQEAWELFLFQKGRCALTDIPLTFPTKSHHSVGTASLDRIDSGRGYVTGNVRWVHKIVNVMRSTMTDRQLLKWCRRILRHHKKRLQHAA
jgi:hypothetical protein